MAFLGSFGKMFLGGASTGQAIGALTGNPALAMGAQAAADAVSKIKKTGSTNMSQGTATSIPDRPAAETSTSGSSDGQNLILNQRFDTSGGIVPAVYRGPNPVTSGRITGQTVNLPAIVGGAVGATRSIGGMIGLAGGAIMVAPTIIDMVTGEEKKLRVTRRLRRQVKEAVTMFGVEVVADNMGTTPEVIFYILTKKMRNDGSYVTKAAVRKTRQTVRKMKHLCDMYDDLRPPARRAPARRATTSKVMQIKN